VAPMSAVGLRAFVVSYRRGSNSQSERYAIVEVEGVTDYRSASRLIGRKVVWTSPNGRRFVGRIVRVHGNGGRVLVRFRRPLPGQAIGTTAVVV